MHCWMKWKWWCALAGETLEVAPSLHLYSIRFNPSFHQTLLFGSLFISLPSVSCYCFVYVVWSAYIGRLPKNRGRVFTSRRSRSESFLENLLLEKFGLYLPYTQCAISPGFEENLVDTIVQNPGSLLPDVFQEDLDTRLPRAADAFKVPSLPNAMIVYLRAKLNGPL